MIISNSKMYCIGVSIDAGSDTDTGYCLIPILGPVSDRYQTDLCQVFSVSCAMLIFPPHRTLCCSHASFKYLLRLLSPLWQTELFYLAKKKKFLALFQKPQICGMSN